SRNFPCPSNADDLCKLGEPFVCNRTAPEDHNFAVLKSDDCRLNAVRCRSAIDDQWDPPIEFLRYVLRCCRTDPSELICAGRSERFVKSTNNSSEPGGRTGPPGHRTNPRRDNVRSDLTLWKNHRERPRPKLVGQFADQLSIARRHIHNSLDPLAI